MNGKDRYERCLTFIQSQMGNGSRKGHKGTDAVPKRVVTISRQAGCGALMVAEKLAEYLQAREKNGSPRWTVFDRNLVERVLEEHRLPQRIGKFMPENWISEIEDTIDELFGLHPPSWLLVRKTAETVLHLAKVGNVILIGRGANVVTAKLEGVFHVRLVAGLESRIRHIQEVKRLDAKEAQAFIQREDTGRRRYLRRYYKRNIDDPLLYHLIINTDLMSYEAAAGLIADCVAGRFGAAEAVGSLSGDVVKTN